MAAKMSKELLNAGMLLEQQKQGSDVQQNFLKHRKPLFWEVQNPRSMSTQHQSNVTLALQGSEVKIKFNDNHLTRFQIVSRAKVLELEMVDMQNWNKQNFV